MLIVLNHDSQDFKDTVPERSSGIQPFEKHKSAMVFSDRIGK